MNILAQTAAQLKALADQHPAVLVSFSGGKDSLAVLDMARRSFQKVVGFFLYFVPGLRCDAERLKIAEDWGIDVLQYPNKAFIGALRGGLYCFRSQAHQSLPEFGQKEIYAAVRNDTGIPYILTGMKKSDSIARKRMLDKFTAKDVVHPLLNWANFDVLAYLKLNNIPLPPMLQNKQCSNGVSLALDSLKFIWENYPDDFERIKEWFPFAEAVRCREKWFWDYVEPKRATA